MTRGDLLTALGLAVTTVVLFELAMHAVGWLIP